ncbi:MAG: uroporphyrinogen-III C-methyltransferase [Terriglobia bacterium]
MNGKVYLVGAGPGDPELLTVKAIRILGEADVVLHDDLVSRAIVKLAAPGALISNVGKRCGKKHVSQEEIQTALVNYARRGLTVVRLKGGDPLIFGRAGEEIGALIEAGIDYEIVPGVTAASCASAWAGISLTDRRTASSLLFLSGHPSVEKLRNEWPDLASERTDLRNATVVVYMPGSDYAKIRDELYAVGVSPKAPCLLVSGASTAASRDHRTSLGKLADAPQLASPKILIVGEVVNRYRTCKEVRADTKSGQDKLPGKPQPSIRRRTEKENRSTALVPQEQR